MPSFPIPAKEWLPAEIQADCAREKEEFRRRRLAGPLNDYLDEFPSAKRAADNIVASLPVILASPPDQELLAKIVGDPEKFKALRYLAAPPISEDDLDTLLNASLTATALRKSPLLADELVSLLKISLDPKRFPWIAAGRKPTALQLSKAKFASAVAAAIAAVQTKRRGDEKDALENDIEALLSGTNWVKVPTPKMHVTLLANGPGPKEFMRHCTLGEHNTDFVIGLRKGRTLAIEAKSSNSEINSRKRLNKEIVVDARSWQQDFGTQIVSAAVLRGVFKPQYVINAQTTPLVIFWGHRLDDLRKFLAAA